MPAPVVPAVPTPCTPGHLYTLMAQCDSNGETSTLFWQSVPGTSPLTPVPHPLAAMMPQLVNLKFTPEQVIQLAATMTPKPCGQK